MSPRNIQKSKAVFSRFITIERILTHFGKNVLFDRIYVELALGVQAVEQDESYNESILIARAGDSSLIYLVLETQDNFFSPEGLDVLKINIVECYDIPLVVPTGNTVDNMVVFNSLDLMSSKTLIAQATMMPDVDNLVKVTDSLICSIENYKRQHRLEFHDDIMNVSFVHNNVFACIEEHTSEELFALGQVYVGTFGKCDQRSLFCLLSGMFREAYKVNQTTTEEDLHWMITLNRMNQHASWTRYGMTGNMPANEMEATDDIKYKYRFALIGCLFHVVDLEIFSGLDVGYVDNLGHERGLIHQNFRLNSEPVIVRRVVMPMCYISVSLCCMLIPEKLRRIYQLKWMGSYQSHFDLIDCAKASSGLMTILGQMQKHAYKMYVEYILREDVFSSEWWYWARWLLTPHRSFSPSEESGVKRKYQAVFKQTGNPGEKMMRLF